MNDAANATPSAREKFEAWLHDNFGKRSIVRAPDGYAHSVAHAALPSTYASVQMLWEAWQAACRAQPTPPAVVEPMTDEQIDTAIQQHGDPVATYRKLHDFARAIEAAHGIGIKKENGNA